MDPKEIHEKRGELIETLEKLMDDMTRLTRGQIEAKYETFATKCPKTYYNILDGKITQRDLVELKEYHCMYTQAYNSAHGRHAKRRMEADIQVGEAMAQKYFYPTMTEKPTQSDQENALRKVKKKYLEAEGSHRVERKQIELKPAQQSDK